MAISGKFMKGNFINRTTNTSRVNFGFERTPLKCGGKSCKHYDRGVGGNEFYLLNFDTFVSCRIKTGHIT